MKHLRHALFSAAALAAVLPASAATFTWARTTDASLSGQWSDPEMWTVSGTDEDGLPDADDTVRFGTQQSNGIKNPALDKVEACQRLEIRLRNDSWVAYTIKFATGGLQLGSGGLYISEGNEWQNPSEFGANFTIELTADQTWEHGGSNFHVYGPVSGPYTITRRGGTGSVSLSFDNARNTFAGLVLDGGSTIYSSSSVVENGVVTRGPLGTGTLVLKSGRLSSTNGGNVLHNPVELAGNGATLGGGRGDWSSTVNSAMVFADNATDAFVLSATEDGTVRTLSTAADVTLRRTISESGATGLRLQKTGDKTLTLAGRAPNTFTGGVEVRKGTLVASKDGACGSGDALVICPDLNTSASLRIAAGVVSAIADSAALRLTGFYDGDAAMRPVVTLDEGVVEKVADLILDGVPQSDGLTYGGASSPADVKLPEWFAGTGVVRVARPATLVILL